MKRIFVLFGAFFLIAIILVMLWLWDPLGNNFDKKEISSKAETYSVEIIRDEWNVPHIFGVHDRDVAFGLGYAHAEDDLATIQETVAAVRGKLARYRGVDAAPTDYLVSLFQVWETVDARYENDVPEDVKQLAKAYADGLNLYALHHKKEIWSGLMPFTEQDVIAGFIFRTPFFYGLDETLLALYGDEYQQQIALDPVAGRQSWIIGPHQMAERGSNAFAITPERAGDGITRLVINSHQPWVGPVTWYEAHLVSEQGLDITGGIFPGSPLILHGFNRNLGWANTVSKPDLADVYVLERHPEKPDHYKLDGDWVAFEKKTAIIRVGLWGPFALKVKRPVLLSRHGPVIEADHGTYAIRYAGMNEIRQLEQYYRLNQAQNFENFMQAMSMNALPSINYIYADKSGNVGFIHNGQYPVHDDRWDWSQDLPGDRSDLIWQGYRPYHEVPSLINPISGLVWNANNTPFAATDGPDNLKSEDFPQSMGLQTNMTNRALRVVELTDGITPIDREALLEIKFDTAYSPRSKTAEIIGKVLAEDWHEDADLAAAAKHLADWNFETMQDNRHAALGVLTVIEIITAKFTGIDPPSPAAAFRKAVKLLQDNYGTVDVSWGEVNRLVRGTVDLPLDGAPDVLRAIYPAELRQDGKLHAINGDSWVAIVEWDDTGAVSADLIHQYGSATLDETSGHYADQSPLFAKKQFRKALIDRADILKNAKSRYHPLER